MVHKKARLTVSKTEQEGHEEKPVRMNFEVDEALRNAFKSTVAPSRQESEGSPCSFYGAIR